MRQQLFLLDTFVMAEENLSAVLYSPGDLQLVGDETKTPKQTTNCFVLFTFFFKL